MLSVTQKSRIKRVAQRLGLLGLINRLEYQKGNPISSASVNFLRQFVQPGSLCFDIGAHLGAQTKTFRLLGARVVAVEPLPDCYETLRRMFSHDREVKVLRTAIGRVRGEATFKICTLSPQLSTLSDDFTRRGPYSDHFQWDKTVQVQVQTLSDLVRDHGVPDYCKLDCEGHDVEILAGLDQKLRAISFEFHLGNEDGKRNMSSGLLRLKELGYEKFNAIGGGADTAFISAVWVSALELERLLLERAQRGEIYGDVFVTV